MQAGGIARLQYLKQQQETISNQSQVRQLEQEQERLELAVAQGQETLQTTISLSQQDLLSKIADNEKQIAAIDSQLNKVMLENKNRIAEIDGQLSQVKVTLNYQELRAPADGTVFDLQPSAPGYVPDGSKPMLKIVPDDALVVKVFITNKDIGFVKAGMPVDVRIDSFPFSEFGDIKGTLVTIGSDAIPPDQARPYYAFPVKIRLERQFLKVNGRDVALQSGMSVSANIKVRQRSVISIFTDLFTNKSETLKFVR